MADSYYQKFKDGPVYLWNDSEELFVRSHPQEGYFAKEPGGEEYPVKASSDVVVRAIDGRLEITRQEYEMG